MESDSVLSGAFSSRMYPIPNPPRGGELQAEVPGGILLGIQIELAELTADVGAPSGRLVQDNLPLKRPALGASRDENVKDLCPAGYHFPSEDNGAHSPFEVLM